MRACMQNSLMMTRVLKRRNDYTVRVAIRNFMILDAAFNGFYLVGATDYAHNNAQF